MKKVFLVILILIILSAPVYARYGTVWEVSRLYNPRTGEHFYTYDDTEHHGLIDYYGYRDEGVAWFSPEYGGEPVYRFCNKRTNDHLFSKDENEMGNLSNEWVLDNWSTVFSSGGSVPVYRLYSPSAQRHHYTTDVSEYNGLAQQGWNCEGIAFYSLAPSEF